VFDNREIGEFSDAELTAARGGGNGIRARQGAASPTSLILTGWPPRRRSTAQLLGVLH
jgi:hypothetical protein